MHPEPQRLVPGVELLIQWADAHSSRYDDAGKSFDQIAHYHYDCSYYLTSDAYPEPLAANATGTACAPHKSFSSTANTRGLHINDAFGRRGWRRRHLRRLRPGPRPGRIVPRRSTPEVGGEEESKPTSGLAHPGGHAAEDIPTTGFRAVSEAVLPLPDVPLIVEDLLAQAKRLADAGAPAAAAAEILDHVAALREGRG